MKIPYTTALIIVLFLVVGSVQAQNVAFKLRKTGEVKTYTADQIKKLNPFILKIGDEKYGRGKIGIVRAESLDTYDLFTYHQWSVEKVERLDGLDASFDAFEKEYIKTANQRDVWAFVGAIGIIGGAIIYSDESYTQSQRNIAGISGLGLSILSGVIVTSKNKKLLKLKRERRSGN